MDETTVAILEDFDLPRIVVFQIPFVSEDYWQI